MSWAVAAALMFVCSVVSYLAIRYASLQKLPVQFNNLASFAVEAVLFVVAAIVLGAGLMVTLPQFVILVLTSVFLAYSSNLASLKSIELAPNAGYSLVISKSYVIMTVFLAVPLFGAQLSWQALLAVLLILGFASMIMINPKAAHHAKAPKSRAWLPLAIGAFVGWGLLSLVAKYLFTQGVAPLTFLAYIAAIVTICILIEIRLSYKRTNRTFLSTASDDTWLRQIRQNWRIFTLIGLAMTGFNYFQFYAISQAPNIGYVNATNAASIAAVTVLSIWLFKDHFSWRKLTGVFGVVAGLFLLFLA